MGEAPRALKALEHQGVVEAEARDLHELRASPLHGPPRSASVASASGAGDAARHHRASQEAVAGQALVQPQELLAEAEAVGVAPGEAGVVDDHPDVADVVVEPLELEQRPPAARPPAAARRAPASASSAWQ